MHDDDAHRRVEPIYTVWDDAAANLASIRHLGCIRIKWDTSQARLHCTVFLVLSLINNVVMRLHSTVFHFCYELTIRGTERERHQLATA